MGLFPDYKELVELAKKYGTLEAQEQIMKLREELVSLREDNLTLREQLKTVGRLSFEMPYYWLVDGAERDGPFCQVCYDKESKTVRLQSRSEATGAWDCRVCGTYFTDRNYIEPNWNSQPKQGDWMGV